MIPFPELVLPGSLRFLGNLACGYDGNEHKVGLPIHGSLACQRQWIVAIVGHPENQNLALIGLN